MMHTNRRWSVAPVATAQELAEKLADGRTWTLCTGFYVEGHPEYLFLNDATSEDGAGEYAVIRGGLSATDRRQVESVTFSWCTVDEAREHIEEALRSDYDEEAFAHDITVRVQTPEEHDTCHRCM